MLRVSRLCRPSFCGRSARGIRTFRDRLPDSPAELEDFLLFYGHRQSTHVTLKDLFDFGRNPSPSTLTLAANFLYEEIPIRLAHQVRNIKKLPMGLGEFPALVAVRQMYEQSFKEIKRFPQPRSRQQEIAFTDMLAAIKNRHRSLQLLVAEGLQNLCIQQPAARTYDFSAFLDEFYMTRIGIRLLLGQHIALHEPRPGFVGVIETNCSLMGQARAAIEGASQLCNYYYKAVPHVEYEGKPELKFTYVPAHVYYVLFELVKNSMRATAEYHKNGSLPPIKVVFAEGAHDVCVKISDQGGGIARDDLSKLWNYSYSTAELSAPPEAAGARPPMAGYGHGLPFSRLYLRFFGGNIEVISMDGYGTDVYAYFSKISSGQKV